jgi:hypothetical protein
MHSLEIQDAPTSRLPSSSWRARRKMLAIAVVLWIASNVFVSSIAAMGAWESGSASPPASSLCKWDCLWYGSVVQSGYSKAVQGDSAPNWVFNPLFPITTYPLHAWLKLPIPASMVLTSKLEFLLAIYAFLLMLTPEMHNTRDIVRAGSLVAFNPYVIYAHAGYAEPLYFALIGLGFYFVNRKQWLLAGGAGAFASATRVTGVVFVVPYFIASLRELRLVYGRQRVSLNVVLGLLLCPLGLALIMLYLHRHMGDALALQHGHIAWGRELRNPFRTLWQCLQQHHWPRVWGVMMIAGWLAAGSLLVLRKPELGAFLLAALFLAFVSPMAGYWGVARYIWWQAPFLYAIWRVLQRAETVLWTVYLAFASGMAAFMVLQWVAGHVVVV